MNRGLSILFVAASLIVLAGCSTTTPMESIGERTVSAQMSSDNPTHQITLGPRQYVTYQIDMPASFTGDMVWFEAITGDGTTGPTLLLDSGGADTYRSFSDRGFELAEGDLLLPVDPSIQTTAIGVNKQCRGPCIAVGSILDTEILQVQNRSSTTLRVDLYVYSDFQQDQNEFNDSTATAALLSRGDDDSGAIELIGDRDYYDVTQSGTFELLVPSGVPIVADILEGDGQTLVETISAGQTAPVLAGDYISVRAVNDAYAGPPNGNAALYFVSLQ